MTDCDDEQIVVEYTPPDQPTSLRILPSAAGIFFWCLKIDFRSVFQDLLNTSLVISQSETRGLFSTISVDNANYPYGV